jgi:uncharacterized alpha-E superfamily protein
MLSRVAESIYWLNRYIERAENVARFIDVNLILSLDITTDKDQQWLPLVTTSGDDEPFKERYAAPTMENVIQFLTLDNKNPNSIISCLTAARENARAIREVISSEMWEHVNKSYLMLHEVRGIDDVLADPHIFFEQVRMCGQQFMGITDATMTHGEGWHFGRVGLHLERADKTARILDVKYFMLLPRPSDVGTPVDEVQWAALLQSASAFEMFRQQFGLIVPDRIIEFLVLDKQFPRAVLYCLTHSRESMHAISGTPIGTFSNSPERLLGQLRAKLAYTRASDIIAQGLHEFVDDLQLHMNEVGAAVHDTFFAQQYAPPEPTTEPQTLTQTMSLD